MSTCPKCGEEVVLASVHNIRNNKWTIVPLDAAPAPDGQGSFAFRQGMSVLHDAVDIMGEVVGEFPVAEYVPGVGTYKTHNPSHYLEA